MKIDESPFAVVEARGTIRRDITADDHRSSAEARSSRTAPGDAHDAAATEERPTVRPRDHVDVSDKVGMFSTALEAAKKTPAIRSNLVREMRELVATGQVGHDVERLATKLIDSIETLSTEQLRSPDVRRRYFIVRS